MRQVGQLPSQSEAQRFSAWLVTQQIDAHVEEEQEGWAIWVRDEDHLQKARAALADFRANPQSAAYQDAERSAQALLKSEESRRRQAQGNVVEMRGRWGSAATGGGVARRAPLVKAIIGITILIGIATYDDTMSREPKRGADALPGTIYRHMTFVDPWTASASETAPSMWSSIQRLQLWRLITPIFIHYGLAHLILNMFWLHTFGGQIEDRRGSAFMAALVLVLALTSNVGQALEATIRGHQSLFGGMSGVNYGLFGYLLVKVRFDNRAGYFLNPGTTFIALLWFFLCIAREVPPFAAVLQHAIPPIANSAHAVGLAVGAAIAYAPLLVRKAS